MMFKRIDVLAAAIVIALVYLVGVFVLQIQANATEWVDNHKLNLLGDTIGGLTAPLALIFLIAAVLIQRQELMLTKAELAKTAEAMQEQVVTAKEQAETAKLQSQALTEQIQLQREIARANYKVSLFEQRFALWNDLRNKIGTLPDLSTAELSELLLYLSKTEFVFGTSVFQKVLPYMTDISALLHDRKTIDADQGSGFFMNILFRMKTEDFHGLSIEADKLEEVIASVRKLNDRALTIKGQMMTDEVIRHLRITMAIDTEIAMASK